MLALVAVILLYTSSNVGDGGGPFLKPFRPEAFLPSWSPKPSKLKKNPYGAPKGLSLFCLPGSPPEPELEMLQRSAETSPWAITKFVWGLLSQPLKPDLGFRVQGSGYRV